MKKYSLYIKVSKTLESGEKYKNNIIIDLTASSEKTARSIAIKKCREIYRKGYKFRIAKIEEL